MSESKKSTSVSRKPKQPEPLSKVDEDTFEENFASLDFVVEVKNDGVEDFLKTVKEKNYELSFDNFAESLVFLSRYGNKYPEFFDNISMQNDQLESCGFCIPTSDADWKDFVCDSIPPMKKNNPELFAELRKLNDVFNNVKRREKLETWVLENKEKVRNIILQYFELKARELYENDSESEEDESESD